MRFLDRHAIANAECKRIFQIGDRRWLIADVWKASCLVTAMTESLVTPFRGSAISHRQSPIWNIPVHSALAITRASASTVDPGDSSPDTLLLMLNAKGSSKSAIGD